MERRAYRNQHAIVTALLNSDNVISIRRTSSNAFWRRILPGDAAYDVERVSVTFLDDHHLPTVEMIAKLRQCNTLVISGHLFDDEHLRVIASSSLRVKNLSLNETSVRFCDIGADWLREIENLYATHSPIDDAGVARIGDSVKLKTLQLRGCPVSDMQLVGGWSRLRKLKLLDLGETEASDKACVSISILPALASLELDETNVTDVGVMSIISLDSLINLSLAECHITDQCGQCFSSMALESLDLSKTCVGDSLCHSLSQMTSLRSLDLSHTKVTDDGVASLSQLTELEYLNLDGCAITDASLNELTKMHGLKDVMLNETEVTSATFSIIKSRLPSLLFGED